jgi:hypothetical protein
METQIKNEQTQLYEEIITYKRFVNRMFKNLFRNTIHIEASIDVFIIPDDYTEITRYIGSSYEDGITTRIDHYEMYLHRENAIVEARAYNYIESGMDIQLTYNPSMDDTLELINERVDYKNNVCYRDYFYYTTDDNPTKSHIAIAPREQYHITFIHDQRVNTYEDIDTAKELAKSIRIKLGLSKQYKKIMNRLSQKMRFIEANTTEEREAFSQEFYEKEFCRRDYW